MAQKHSFAASVTACLFAPEHLLENYPYFTASETKASKVLNSTFKSIADFMITGTSKMP